MLSKKQGWLYWREFNAAVAYAKQHGQTVPNRHELHRQALGSDKSSKDFTNADLDKFLAVCRAITKPASLNAQMRQQRQPRTRLEFAVLNERLPMLAVCLGKIKAMEQWALGNQAFVTIEYEAAEAFITNLMFDRFKTTDLKLVSDEPKPRSNDYEKSDLELLRDTLDARINDKRKLAKLTIHEMKIAAGLHCNCARCEKASFHHQATKAPSAEVAA